MTAEELLEKRHEVKLEWAEPWPACGPQGNGLEANVVMSATVHDCVNLQRAAAQAKGQPTTGDDAALLTDFMAVHWASPVKTINTFGTIKF